MVYFRESRGLAPFAMLLPFLCLGLFVVLTSASALQARRPAADEDGERVLSLPTPTAALAIERATFNRSIPPVRDYSARGTQRLRTSPRSFHRETLRAANVAPLSPGFPPHQTVSLLSHARRY